MYTKFFFFFTVLSLRLEETNTSDNLLMQRRVRPIRLSPLVEYIE